MNISTKISRTLYVMKAFAILSVVTAHMTFSANYPIPEIIRISIGQIGVVIFVVLSGYFYQRKSADTKAYWRKKAKSIFLPWFIMSTIVFIVSVVLTGNREDIILRFIKNFFGIGTVYWYMTIIVVMMIVFKYIKNDFVLFLCIGITILSVTLSSFGVIKYSGMINQYLNVFNWIGFFALGILFRRYNVLGKMINHYIAVLSLLGTIGFIAVAIYRGNHIEAYVDVTSLGIEFFSFLLFLNISYFCSESKILVDVGKKSFFIYLMHIQVVGIVNTRLPYNTVFFILRPFIGLTVCYLIAISFKFILNRMKLKKYNFVFGLDR